MGACWLAAPAQPTLGCDKVPYEGPSKVLVKVVADRYLQMRCINAGQQFTVKLLAKMRMKSRQTRSYCSG